MDVGDQPAQSAPPTRPQLTKTPIAHLSPTLELPENKCIYATVSLIWPYSSSTKSLGLLLAEPDFRLRRSNGQVKAVFHGRVAESVAEQHVGIGDTVCLSLKYSSFVPNDAVSQTPGRNIAWDVHFERGLTLEACQHYISQSPEELAPTRGSWGSPAFHKSSRKSSGSAVGFAFDPFAEEDGFVPGKGRKRPRYSLQRTEWRVVDEPESPEERQEHEEPMDWEKALDAEVDLESETEKPADVEPAKDASIPETAPETVPDTVPDTSDKVTQVNNEDPFQDEQSVFVKPSLDLAESLFGRRTPQNFDAGPTTSVSQSPFGNLFNRPTDTPQLRPIPSPGLPIPSPLISNSSNHQEYFAPIPTAPPAHDVHHALTSDSNSLIQELDSLVEGAQEPALHGLPQLMEHPETAQDEGELSYPPPPLDSHQSPNSLLSNSLVGEVNQLPTVDLDQLDSHAVMNGSTIVETDTGLDISEELHLAVSTGNIDEQLLEETNDVTPEADYESHVPSNLEAGDEEVEGSQGTSPRSALPEMEVDEAESGEDVLDETAAQDEAQSLHEVANVYPGTLSGSDSDSHSDVEEEARYDEDAEGEYYSEDEFSEEEEIEPVYGDDIDEGSSEDEDNEAHRLPPAQPEVIVLDSDSEDEDASEQPAATFPHHARQRSVSSDASQSSAEGDGEDWPDVEDDADHHVLEDQESVEYQSEDEYEHPHPDQDDRVHDSDMEDESSVDALVRDDRSEEHSTRDRSVDEAPDGEQDLEPHAESDEVAQPEENLDSFTSVEVHEDQPDSAKDAPSPAEELSPHDLAEEQVQSPLDDEERTSGGTLSAFITLDGAHDPPDWSKAIEKDHQTPLEQGTHAIEEETSERPEKSPVPDDEIDVQHSNKGLSFEVPAFDTTDQQLPTPDPTQEVSPSYKPGPDNYQPAELLVTDEQALPVGLDISLPPVSEEPVVSAPAELRVAGERAPSVGQDTPLPPVSEEEPITLEQQDAADGVGVVLPTTELLEDCQQDGEEIAAPESTDKALETPTVVISKPPAPDRDAHGLRSKLSYFAPLATLADHYNALVDTISVVYEFSPVAKATSGSRDYFMTIYLTDPSMAGTTLQAQIFRHYKSAMPPIAEGQAILLRDFKVQSHNHSMTLVSVESSSWAVFDGSSPDAKMTGPPVEYGSEEQAFAAGLRRWYFEAGASLVADSQLQASVARDSRSMTPSSVAASEAGSPDGTPSSARGSRRSRRSRRRVTIHELRDGTRYTEVGSPSGQHGIHELRDGTVYANE
ncbi:hypothetical protein PENSUB_7600 [Penicillium subrubescens]|uniref:Telomeric single stranded DNA binding POT1/Cdc13 domain-containing protein n=1 Tax=Penicillium subrubescens TaxID=1316194 RepID=A0A1Q5TLF1_9EURO|nr:hypothetical protein PENSUB_7600 [Penicillium subrubescens]